MADLTLDRDDLRAGSRALRRRGAGRGGRARPRREPLRPHLYDDHVGELLQQAVSYVQHLRLGQADRARPITISESPA